MDVVFGQLPYKCHLEEVVSVGDRLAICPQLDSRMDYKLCTESRPNAGFLAAGVLVALSRRRKLTFRRLKLDKDSPSWWTEGNFPEILPVV